VENDLFKGSASLLNKLLILLRIPVKNLHEIKPSTNVCLLSSGDVVGRTAVQAANATSCGRRCEAAAVQRSGANWFC
jgi:hypothetical protein